MIDPITGTVLADAMAGLTGEMTGLTLAEAWEQQGFKDPAEAGYGVDFGVNAGILGKDKPAISGDTSGSISSSQQADPVDAWHDYVENELGSVDKTTGGIVDGSNTGAFNYSLLVSSSDGSIKAVAPVAVPIDQAYTAISQALGVSMDAAQMDVETKQAFAQSIIDGEDLIYDAATGLVKAWWDGVNILFPKKTVEAISDTIEELGISDEGGSATSPLTWGSFPKPFAIGGNLINRYGWYLSVDDGVVIITGLVSDGSFGTAVFASSTPGKHYYQIRSDGGVERTSPIGDSFTYDNQTVYCSFTTETSRPITGALNVVTGGINQTDSRRIAWTAIYGEVTPAGEYPEGTAKSIAQKYNLDDLPVAGGIAAASTSVIPTIPINLPLDPLNTIESDADPVTTPTTPEQQKDLPAPPLPLPIPDTNVSNPDVPLVDSSVVNSTLINELVEELANTLDPQPGQSSGIIPFPLLPGIPDGQGGSAYPSIVPASGSGLVHVYNPTPGEMVSFGNWLWVTYADASIEKIWNNPFDGIIGAFELYSTPQTNGTDNIRSGFLTCPTTAKLVRQRYTEIDCGTVIVPEFYGNYLDYSPYSQAYIYLPFIGINEVSIDDIVGHAINIRYRIDAYNGSCIAMIYVAKNGYRNLCYQFAGNCAVEVPLAGGSQAAIKAGVLQAEAYARASIANSAISAASQIGAGIASGSVAGIVMGALGGLGTAAAGAYGASQSKQAARVANKSTVQHSGQFGASHGAMGLKIPHIIIRNPIQVKVVNYNDDYGFPAHKRVIVGGCRGYLRVREVNVISAHATDEEKALIEALLKNGVYVS